MAEKWHKRWLKDLSQQVNVICVVYLTILIKILIFIFLGLSKGENMIASNHPADVASQQAFRVFEINTNVYYYS